MALDRMDIWCFRCSSPDWIKDAVSNKDVSSSSSASTDSSVRNDLKMLLGSVNSLTLAQHDLLSVVPALTMDGEMMSESSTTDS
ncbi:hypothetical protein CF327_g7576, partial [Tilletia walkeri]